MSNKGLLVLK